MSNKAFFFSNDTPRETPLSMYANEPCRICGKLLSSEDVNDAVFAGYDRSDKSRSAHGECWRSNKSKQEWAYPEDAV